MLLSDLKDKVVAIWGMGSEGTAVKEYLTRNNITSEIFTYNDGDGESAYNDILQKAQVVVRSPGVSIYKKEWRQLQEAGIKTTSSTDLFLNEIRANHPQTTIVGISGSKGKSMSVSMLFHIMLKTGCKVALGGNIGKPLIELLDKDYDYVICEISSYQASDLTVSPQVIMFTNLFSVHTDWHNGHDNYCRDKVHLAAHQLKGEICLINDRNPTLKSYCENCRNPRYYNVLEGFHAEGRDLYYQNQKLLSIDDMKICGIHNIENLAGVMSIVKHLGLDVAKAIDAVKTLEPLQHRLQKVGCVDNVLFINDSISTAPEAAIAAMKSFDDNLAIISGGIENQQDYTDYAKYIQENPKVKVAVTLFQCGRQIADTIRQNVTRPDFKLIEAENLREGVTLAFEELKAVNGSLMLFSPTAPSFGYYKNFMERGQDFINIVKSLEK